MKYPTLVIYATSLYLHVKTNKCCFNQNHMVQRSIEDLFIPFQNVLLIVNHFPIMDLKNLFIK